MRSVLLPLFLVLAGIGPVQASEETTQEVLDEAIDCINLYAIAGQKEMGRMIFISLLPMLEQDDGLKLRSPEGEMKKSEERVDFIKGMFKQDVSNKEAAYYLIGSNGCYTHVVFGAFEAMRRKQAESK